MVFQVGPGILNELNREKTIVAARKFLIAPNVFVLQRERKLNRRRTIWKNRIYLNVDIVGMFNVFLLRRLDFDWKII